MSNAGALYDSLPEQQQPSEDEPYKVLRHPAELALNTQLSHWPPYLKFSMKMARKTAAKGQWHQRFRRAREIKITKMVNFLFDNSMKII
jgi:hypothetical protein